MAKLYRIYCDIYEYGRWKLIVKLKFGRVDDELFGSIFTTKL